MGQPRPHSSSNGAGSGAEHGPCSPPPPTQPALTHHQLPHFLPADVAARLVQKGHGDPSLDALPGTRGEDTVRRLDGREGRGWGRGGLRGSGRGGLWGGRGIEVSAPGGAGRSPCTASRHGGPPLPGCSWERGGRAEGVPSQAPRAAQTAGPRGGAEGRETPPAALGPLLPACPADPCPALRGQHRLQTHSPLASSSQISK